MYNKYNFLDIDFFYGFMFITFQAYLMPVFGNQKRSFNSKYYNEYNWLEYSIDKNAVFCYCCRVFGCDFKHNVFIKNGFTDWKRVINYTLL